MCLMMGLELAAILFDVWPLQAGVIACVVVLPVLGLPALRGREFYLLSAAAVLAAIALWRDGFNVELYWQALSRSGFLASFILLMGLLRDGAVTSSAVAQCGAFITRQPSRRRFFAVFSGAHAFAVLINLGALSLLAPIIQLGVRQGKPPGEPLDEISQIRERRQLTAVLRGFSWFLVWAPTAVTQAVLPTLMTGVDSLRLIKLGLGIAAVMFLTSWAEDTMRWWSYRKKLVSEGALPSFQPMPFPSQSFRNLGAVCFGLFGLSIGFLTLVGTSIVEAVMLSAPLVVVTWILAQNSHMGTAGAVRATRARLIEIATTAVPGSIRETVSLAAAGFIGTLAAHLTPVDVLSQWLDPNVVPAWVFMLGLALAVLAGGQIALSPITMAVFLGSVVAAMPTIPADATLAALGIAAGTAICTTGSPFASGTLVLARASGRTGVELTWRWNLAYTIAACAVLAILFAAITGGR